jgi:ABC-type lipoprotein export system ATPase subunit
MPSDLLLELNNVAKGYDGGEGPVPVLRDVSLQLGHGEAAAIVGASGSGKSTLLNVIGTLDRPDAGRVLLAGRDLASLDEGELAVVRSQEIGFIFQLHHLLPSCTVLENVLVPTLATGRNARRGAPEARARRLLDRVGLTPRLGHRPGQLSGGERQRAAVVRAVINEPRLVLADEPTGSLDEAAAANLTRLLVELHQEEQVALLVVTHAPEVAARMGRVLELRGGRLGPRGEA